MVFDGVPTGRIKENEQAMVTGSIRLNGLFSVSRAYN
jgi:hypothetical protein